MFNQKQEASLIVTKTRIRISDASKKKEKVHFDK